MTLAYESTRRRQVAIGRWLVAASVVASVGLNTAAAVVGSQSDQQETPTLVDPAGYAFSIWFVIFAGNLAFAAYQLRPQQRDDPRLDRAVAPFVVGQLMGAAFAVASLADMTRLGQAATAGYFVAAVVTYVALGVGVGPADYARRLAAWVPASLSAGWLLAATIVASASFLQNDAQLSAPFGAPIFWASLVLLVAAATGVALIRLRDDITYALVVAWALVAVSVEQQRLAVDVAALTGVGAILIAVAFWLFTRVRARQQQQA